MISASQILTGLRRPAAAAGLIGVLAASIALGTAVAEAATDTGAPPAPLILKQATVVSDEAVYLSDLFANVPFHQDMVVAEAPAPGQRIAFSARQLAHIARQARLAWMPSDPRQGIIVSRDSQSLPTDAVERALAGAIADRHQGGDFDIALFDRSIELHVPAGTEPRVIVSGLDLDTRAGRFRASVTAAGAEGREIEVTGRLVPMVELPVLTRHLMPGDIIADRDVAWKRVPARQATTTAITRLDDLLGYTPRRPIAAGRPVRMTDVVPDYVVQKGDLVTIQLRAGAMTLTARGRALQRGAKGDVIRIRNTQSQKTIEAEVVAADTAMVRPPRLASAH